MFSLLIGPLFEIEVSSSCPSSGSSGIGHQVLDQGTSSPFALGPQKLFISSLDAAVLFVEVLQLVELFMLSIVPFPPFFW